MASSAECALCDARFQQELMAKRGRQGFHHWRVTRAVQSPCYAFTLGKDEENIMNLIVLLIILIILSGGGGFYFGGPYVGGGLGTILLIVLIVLLVRGG
jgi:hypothetical protein